MGAPVDLRPLAVIGCPKLPCRQRGGLVGKRRSGRLGPVRELLTRPVYHATALGGLVLGVFVWMTLWLCWLPQAPLPEESAARDSRPRVGVVLSRLVVEEIGSATGVWEIRAATAELLRGQRVFHLVQVEARGRGMQGMAPLGPVGNATATAFLRADKGWVDPRRGNVLLSGDVSALRSDGLAISATRLEYESAADEIRFASSVLRAPGLVNRAPFIVTDSRLRRIRFLSEYQSDNAFFQRFLGGNRHD